MGTLLQRAREGEEVSKDEIYSVLDAIQCCVVAREREADWGYVQGNNCTERNKITSGEQIKVEMRRMDTHLAHTSSRTQLHSRPRRRMRPVRHCICICPRSGLQSPLGLRCTSPPRQGGTLTSTTRRSAPSARSLEGRFSSCILHPKPYKDISKSLLTFLEMVGHLRRIRIAWHQTCRVIFLQPRSKQPCLQESCFFSRPRVWLIQISLRVQDIVCGP